MSARLYKGGSGARSFGRPHRHYRVTDSTNQRARELAAAGAPGGSVVTAAEQTAGRGRQGRRWSAPAGKALLYSAIVRPLEQRHGLLPLAAPLAVCEAAESLAPVRCQVKWPNDIWVEERKLAGVLIEARFASPRESAGLAPGEAGWAVIGIGLNVAIEPEEFPSGLRWPATSIGHSVTVTEALAALNERLAAWVDADAARVLSGYRERDALRGRRISWRLPGEAKTESGRASEVDDRGNLVVVRDDGERVALGAGEVHLVSAKTA